MAQSPLANPKSSQSSTAVVEQQVRAFLDQGRWRKARDEAKALVKLDRPRYLPLLIQANIGLAREMMSKGMVSEAQQVLNYLATIAPPEQIKALELEMAGQGAAQPSSLGSFLALLAAPENHLPEAERVRLADQLVLAFKPIPDAEPSVADLAAQTQAIQEGLQAVSESRWDRVGELARSVPRKSPFSHWAALIKGQAAFYGGQFDKAQRHFESLPPGSVPARAAQVFRFLAGDPETLRVGAWKSQAFLDQVCRLSGAPAAGAALLRAEAKWKERRYWDSYRALREAIPGFPSGQLNWLGEMSVFYFTAPYGMALAERDDYLYQFDVVLGAKYKRRKVEEMLACRMFALANGGPGSAYGVRADWEGFLNARQSLFGYNPRLASMVHARVGEVLSQPQSTGFHFGRRRGNMRDAAGALEALQRSIDIDPNNLPAYLKLCEVYRALKQSSERNRLLDAMTARFPEDKRVLLEAGRGCIDRKAYVKGLDYLERARQLDRLDPNLLDLMAVARRDQAREYYRKQRPDKGRQTLAQVEAHLTDKPDDFQRGRWCHLALHGLMEQLWGDGALAQTLLEQARATGPMPEGVPLFLHFAHRAYAGEIDGGSPFRDELRAALKRSPTVKAGALLLRIFDCWQEESTVRFMRVEEKLIADYLYAAAAHPFARQEAIEVIERTIEEMLYPEAVKRLIKRALKSDPKDPRFRLYDLRLEQCYWDPNFDKLRAQLQEIIDEAGRRQDDATVRKARELLRSLEVQPLPPPDPFDFEDPGDYEDEDYDEPEDWEAQPLPPLPPLPPGPGGPDLKIFFEYLRQAPPKQIKWLRKKLTKDVPVEFFDALVEAAQSGLPFPFPPGPPPAPKNPPHPPPAPPDPNQLNLF